MFTVHFPVVMTQDSGARNQITLQVLLFLAVFMAKADPNSWRKSSFQENSCKIMQIRFARQEKENSH